MTDKRELVGMDIGKFIFAIFTISIHVVPFGINPKLQFLNGITQSLFGKLAVPFFFVVAGYFLFTKIGKSNEKKKVVIEYIKRIAILYIIWSIIYLPFNILEYKGESVTGFLVKYAHDFFVVGSYFQLWYLLALIVAVLLVAGLLYFNVNEYIILAIGILLFIAGCLTQSWYGLIKPLQTTLPGLWECLKTLKSFFVTARNGIFEGFAFVAIGMVIAKKRKEITLKKSIIGFVASLGLIVIEYLVVTKLHFQKFNMLYISLLPAAFFAFFVFFNIKCNKVKLGLYLRRMSTIIYLIHMLVFNISLMILEKYYHGIKDSIVMFYIVVALSTASAFVIVYLSQKRKTKFLKILY